MTRRARNDARARARCRERKWRKIKSCDPRRLWPLDSVQRQDFEVRWSGDYTRMLKWLYGGRDRFMGQKPWVERLFYENRGSALFGLLRRTG